MMANQYIDIVSQTIQTAWNSQKAIMDFAAEKLANTIKAKNSIHIFGCSHAGILAEEVFYRTGGLALINPIFFSGFMLNAKPITLTSQLERLSGLASIILEQNHVKNQDILIIHSVSGRNVVPIEMAIEAKKLGVFLICITNKAYTQSVSSRHSSGKMLYELCDIVIDNFGSIGDAAIKLEGLKEKIGPTSTTVGTALLNGLIIETVELLLRENIVPPVFLSANIDGGDDHNKSIFNSYKESIFYL